jgi:hypothetical protein
VSQLLFYFLFTFMKTIKLPIQNLRYMLLAFSFLLGLFTREDGTDILSRNVGKQLPYDAAKYPRRPHISI